MRSMTGFGRGQAAVPGYGIVAEVRSVNGRQREVRLKLPTELADQDARFRKMVHDRIARGRVEVYVGLDRADGRAVGLRLHRGLARSLMDEARQLKDELGLSGELDLRAVLQIQGVVEVVPARESENEALAEGAAEALIAALDAHARAREAEGGRLLDDFRARFADMAGRRASMVARAPEEVAHIAARLRRRVAELAADTAVDEARMAQEIAFLADKADIAEELVRLESHLAEAETILGTTNEPVGRRLEFLLQEILREANTIASKSGDLDIGRDALEIKIEVDKAREQVQNVE